MVEDYLRLVPILKANKKIDLVAFLKMDELTDRWSILVSGNGLNSTDKRKALFEEVSKILRRSLTSEEKNSIARIGVFPLSSHLVRDIRGYDEGAYVEDTRANGNYIHLRLGKYPYACIDRTA